MLLVAGQEDVHTWHENCCKADEALEEMRQSRSKAAELSKKYDIR